MKRATIALTLAMLALTFANVSSADQPPPADRWEKLLQSKDLIPRQRAAYEQIGKLHTSHLVQLGVPGGIEVPSIEEDSKDPADVLYRMGIDILPMLADALDDETATKTVTEHGNGDRKVVKVNELAALLIVRIADRDFVVGKKTKEITIGQIGSNAATAPEFKKAVIAWYDAFAKKTPLERKIADVNDGWFRNRMDAVIWLGEHKAAEGRAVIEAWVDGFYGDKKEHPSSLTRAEMAACALALGQIGDKKSLPQVRRVCQDISDEEGQRPADFFITPDLFMAYHGLSLLGAKPEAIKELNRLLVEYGTKMVEQNARQEYEKRLKEASDW